VVDAVIYGRVMLVAPASTPDHQSTSRLSACASDALVNTDNAALKGLRLGSAYSDKAQAAALGEKDRPALSRYVLEDEVKGDVCGSNIGA
jgi:hypothetical protein